ncbi:hypothetical protein AAFN88_17680 [Pelagibius sp. CAU 1746]|uniref:hypothetical protein n=1 Tax=Pelagibius sp. CAU 1746 TaxID=3140370 RepID=UPI00325B2F1D
MAEVKHRTTNSVRVSIPMSVASDIGQFKKSLGSILERLGCPACCSAHDIYFEMQRDFRFDGDLDIAQAAFAPKRLAAASAPVVSASLSPKLSGNIKEVFKALDRIVDLSAHPACTSGDDLFLRIESNFLINAAGQLDEQALVIGR